MLAVATVDRCTSQVVSYDDCALPSHSVTRSALHTSSARKPLHCVSLDVHNRLGVLLRFRLLGVAIPSSLPLCRRPLALRSPCLTSLRSSLPPPKPDRGRRIHPATSLYQSSTAGDYLHDHRPLHEQVTPVVGVVNSRPQRFHRGFYRRSEADIGVTEARQQREEARERRCDEVGRQRRVVLAARQGQCEHERDLFPHKRHFTAHYTATALTQQPPAPYCPSPPATQQLPPFSTTSRVIGARCGKGDMLGSYGVLDNFMGDGYGSLDWQPAKPEQRRSGRRSGLQDAMAVVDGEGLGDARRQRQVEYARNARQGSQLSYLFGSSAERAQSV